MSDSFFQKKRKWASSSGDGADRKAGKRSNAKAGPSRRRRRDVESQRERGGEQEEEGEDDDDTGGIDEMDLRHDFDGRDRGGSTSEEDEMDETPAEARVRLAKAYLEGLRGDQEETDGGAEAAEADRQNISARLQQDVATRSTHVSHFLADRLYLPPASSTEHVLATRGHTVSVTSAKVGSSNDCSWLFTAGKDGRILRWRLRDGKLVEIVPRAHREGTKRKTPISKSSGAARRRFRAEEAQKKSGELKELANGSAEEESRGRTVDLKQGQGHTDEIWALTVSHDGNYLVSGGKDRKICVWALPKPSSKIEIGTNRDKDSTHNQTSFIKALGGHKDAVTSLAFRQGSHDLFTASLDRTLKLFDVAQRSYVETFFGHQEAVGALDILRGEVAVSAGMRDRTVRWWKVREESQLVFRGGAKSKVREVLEGGDIMDGTELPEEEENAMEMTDGPRSKAKASHKARQKQEWVEGSIDCVAMVDEHTFLSGGDSGTISLWSLSKKKPVFTQAVAHGYHEARVRSGDDVEGFPASRSTTTTILTPRWITSLASLPYGDLFASGSWDGQIRMWKLDRQLKKFSLFTTVPALGFVNSLQILSPTTNLLKKGPVIEQEKWTRKGVLTIGPKKVFTSDEGNNVNEREAEGSNAVESKKGNLAIILVAAIGQEATQGRWLKMKEARNGALIVPFYLLAS